MLDATESARARRVLRLSEGAAIQVFDGRGGAFRATLSGSAPGGRVRIACADPLPAPEPIVRLTVGVAILKGDGMTAIVRQLAELGVDRVRPLLTERSEGRTSASRQRRWQSAALAGTRQCGGALVPDVEAPVRLTDWMTEPLPEARFIALPGDAAASGTASGRWRYAGNRVALAVGPEGGFSPAEAEAARTRGWRPLRLGNRVLRTGTAAATAAARILIPVSLPGR